MDIAKQLQRTNFYPGMLLTTDDFMCEQNYFLEKNRRHNRFLHGWGVAIGFEIKAQNSSIFVEPGLAIDCAGNEIFLDTTAENAMPKRTGAYYVVVEYCESNVRPVPTLNDSSADESRIAYTRTQEGCRVSVVDADPNSGHAAPGTPGCGSQHPIAIGRIRVGSSGCKVRPLGRR